MIVLETMRKSLETTYGGIWHIGWLAWKQRARQSKRRSQAHRFWEITEWCMVPGVELSQSKLGETWKDPLILTKACFTQRLKFTDPSVVACITITKHKHHAWGICIAIDSKYEHWLMVSLLLWHLKHENHSYNSSQKSRIEIKKCPDFSFSDS